jgi:hypothetical protein
MPYAMGKKKIENKEAQKDSIFCRTWLIAEVYLTKGKSCCRALALCSFFARRRGIIGFSAK